MATQNSQPHVGLSLVAKAPIAVVITIVLIVVVAALSAPLWHVLGFSALAGLVCGALLLAYWSGKGGIFFIVGLLVPLINVMAIDLSSFTSLYQLILAFFCGFWLSLWVFKLVTGNESSGAPR